MAEDLKEQPKPEQPKEQPKPESQEGSKPISPEIGFSGPIEIPPPKVKKPEYSMRGDSASIPFSFNDSEKFIAEDNNYYRNVLKDKRANIDIKESMKWENLYYDEIEDYNRKLWLTILVSAVVIFGRLLL
jgi:hypothetical protein